VSINEYAQINHVLLWQDKWRLEERVLMIEQSAAAMADEICRYLSIIVLQYYNPQYGY
jgi:hypothetical protein